MAITKSGKKKMVFWVIILVSLILLFFLTYQIFLPSYLSVSWACNTKYPKILNSIYQQAGFYNTTSQNITIILEGESGSTLRHELCHKKQDEEGRMGNCCSFTGKLRLFINELECKFASTTI